MTTRTDVTVVNQAYDTSGNGGRKLIHLSDGSKVAVYKVPSSRFEIKYTNDGTNWTLVKSITGISNLVDVCLVPIGNDIGVLYSFGSQVSFARYRKDGTLVGTGYNIDTFQNAVGNVSLAINSAGTELHAAWASKNSTFPNSFNIRYAKGTINADGSVTWGAVEQVTMFNSISSYITSPSITIVNGVPVLLVEVDNNLFTAADLLFDYSIWAIKRDRTLTYTGTYVHGNWSIGNVYHGDTYIQANPSACVDKNGRIWVAWHGYDATDTSRLNIRVSYSDNGGQTWSASTKLTSGNTRDNANASITVNRNNEVFVVFNGHPSSGTSYNVIKKIKYSSGSWGAVTEITTSDSYYPSTLLDTSIDFSEPIFIYKNVASAKVGFYGTWTVTTISVPQGYIGQKSDKSNILMYSITTDGTMGTITEKINGTVINTRTSPTSGQQFTVSLNQSQWDAIKFGNGHTLTIEMGSDTWTYTFDKRLNANDDILSAVKGVHDLQTHLNEIKAQLGAAIRAKGGTVNDTDVFSAFVSAVGSIPVKRWASGTATSSASRILTVSGLGFTPSIVIVFALGTNGTIRGDIRVYSNVKDISESGNNTYGIQSGNTSGTYTRYSSANNPIVNGGFSVTTLFASNSYKWIAIE